MLLLSLMKAGLPVSGLTGDFKGKLIHLVKEQQADVRISGEDGTETTVPGTRKGGKHAETEDR